MSWNVQMPTAEWFTPTTRGLEATVNECADTKEVAIDTETTGLLMMKDYVLYWSMSWERPNGQIRRMCLRADTLQYFTDVFRARERDWVLANAKYDQHVLTNTGFHLAGQLCDTMVAHALLEEEAEHGLKAMTESVLGWRWVDFVGTFGKVNKADPNDSIGRRLLEAEQKDLSALVEYASNDAYGTLLLYKELRRRLQATPTHSAYPEHFATMWDLFYKSEVPFTRVLWECERAGFLIDEGHLQRVSAQVDTRLSEARRLITHYAGKPINPKGADLRALLFDELKLTPVSYTDGGTSGIRQPKTDRDALVEMGEKTSDPEIRKLLTSLIDFSQLINLKTTFIPNLLRNRDGQGRLHTNFNQARAVTGRLSSSSPNLQNVKHPDKDEFKLRKAFIAPQGMVMVAADYEALEMMVLAAAAQEEKMLDIFRRGWDIHMGNAATVYGYKYEDIKEAKKVDKLVKEHTLPESAMTKFYRECLDARQAVKVIGYG